MRILNFGSVNIDKVYAMPHLIREKETLSSLSLKTFAGGKGLNQSVALARAGASVLHAGRIGRDGGMPLSLLRDSGVDVSCLEEDAGTGTGHAIIQVDQRGQNCIILHGGANQTVTEEFVDAVLASFSAGEFLLLQNEISCLRYIVDKAHAKGMRIALNPAPMDEKITALDLAKIEWLILNEVEGEGLSGESEPDAICDTLLARFPGAKLVLTLGGDGSVYADKNTRIRQDILKVPVVDTTAAGDTFIGYFLAAILEDRAPEYALRVASIASALAVSREGASQSVPHRDEVLANM